MLERKENWNEKADFYDHMESKYGKLMHKISHWISGDIAIASHDDNVQDLWLVAYTTMETFSRLNLEQYPNGFEDYKDTKHWDKYIKTALWNNKNSRGAKITKKFNITRNTVDIVDNEEVLQKEDPSVACSDTDIFLEEIQPMLTDDQRVLVRSILEDPTYIKPSGKVNINALAKNTGKTWNDVSILLKDLGRRICNEL